MSSTRHIVTDGIILQTYLFREFDKNLVLISPDLGVIKATAFGACKVKSRFCSTVQPFVVARMFLYYNPQDNSYKLEDISDVDTNDQLKLDIKKIYLLSFCFDIVRECFISNEDYKSYYYLLLYTIDLLKNSANYVTAYLFFISKFFFLSGYIPSLDKCQKCGSISDIYYFQINDGGLFCKHCANNLHHLLNKNVADIFAHFLQDKYVHLRQVCVSQQCFMQLYPITVSMLNNIFEHKIKTIENLKFVFGI